MPVCFYSAYRVLRIVLSRGVRPTTCACIERYTAWTAAKGTFFAQILATQVPGRTSTNATTASPALLVMGEPTRVWSVLSGLAFRPPCETGRSPRWKFGFLTAHLGTLHKQGIDEMACSLKFVWQPCRYTIDRSKAVLIFTTSLARYVRLVVQNRST